MRLKFAQFLGGMIIYSLFGLLMVWISGTGMKGQWTFIIIWTVGMSLMHLFIIEPMRDRLAKKRVNQQKK
jgi:Na+/melibiose symporter-like transporter